MDWNNGDQRHQKRGRQARLYDKAGPISPRRKDEHQYTRMGKGEIASPNSTSRLLPLRVIRVGRDRAPRSAYVRSASEANMISGSQKVATTATRPPRQGSRTASARRSRGMP